MPRIILRKPSRRSQHLSTIVIHRRLLNLLGLFLLANLPTITYALDPTAIATTTNVDTAGATVYSFTVKYTDDGLLLGSFGDDNVRVTGPAGFDVRGRFVSESPNALGNQITVTYSITPPGGSWDAGDNGTYTIVMQPGQVNDQLGNPVAAGPIGAFTVAAPGPVASPTPSATPSLTRLANISTRLLVETGDNALIGGFIITGTQAKKVILRAIGPSISLTGTLQNPTLELYGPGGLITANDDWQNSSNKQAIIDSTVPPTNDLESAIVATLPANGAGYSGVVRGAGNAIGIGVIEVYDLDLTTDSKLANISTRGFVQTGNNVLIAGTIIVGSTSQKIIVRAIGPSLSIPGKLADPTLELRDGNGVLLESNDNWGDSSNKQAIIDSTIPPTNALESAIVRTLAPANYTAIVRGPNNTTGIAVVEVYALN